MLPYHMIPTHSAAILRPGAPQKTAALAAAAAAPGSHHARTGHPQPGRPAAGVSAGPGQLSTRTSDPTPCDIISSN
eukprot:698258-Hanusia_phi.AAC.3